MWVSHGRTTFDPFGRVAGAEGFWMPIVAYTARGETASFRMVVRNWSVVWYRSALYCARDRAPNATYCTHGREVRCEWSALSHTDKCSVICRSYYPYVSSNAVGHGWR